MDCRFFFLFKALSQDASQVLTNVSWNDWDFCGIRRSCAAAYVVDMAVQVIGKEEKTGSGRLGGGGMERHPVRSLF